jgi:hypothetical protein
MSNRLVINLVHYGPRDQIMRMAVSGKGEINIILIAPINT